MYKQVLIFSQDTKASLLSLHLKVTSSWFALKVIRIVRPVSSSPVTLVEHSISGSPAEKFMNVFSMTLFAYTNKATYGHHQ